VPERGFGVTLRVLRFTGFLTGAVEPSLAAKIKLVIATSSSAIDAGRARATGRKSPRGHPLAHRPSTEPPSRPSRPRKSRSLDALSTQPVRRAARRFFLRGLLIWNCSIATLIAVSASAPRRSREASRERGITISQVCIFGGGFFAAISKFTAGRLERRVGCLRSAVYSTMRGTR
jgi:hypothetical protein